MSTQLCNERLGLDFSIHLEARAALGGGGGDLGSGTALGGGGGDLGGGTALGGGGGDLRGDTASGLSRNDKSH